MTNAFADKRAVINGQIAAKSVDCRGYPTPYSLLLLPVFPFGVLHIFCMLTCQMQQQPVTTTTIHLHANFATFSSLLLFASLLFASLLACCLAVRLITSPSAKPSQVECESSARRGFFLVSVRYTNACMFMPVNVAVAAVRVLLNYVLH